MHLVGIIFTTKAWCTEPQILKKTNSVFGSVLLLHRTKWHLALFPSFVCFIETVGLQIDCRCLSLCVSAGTHSFTFSWLINTSNRGCEHRAQMAGRSVTACNKFWEELEWKSQSVIKREFSQEIFEKNTKILNFMKIPLLVGKLFCADGRTDRRTDMTKLIVALWNFSNSPKNQSVNAV